MLWDWVALYFSKQFSCPLFKILFSFSGRKSLDTEQNFTFNDGASKMVVRTQTANLNVLLLWDYLSSTNYTLMYPRGTYSLFITFIRIKGRIIFYRYFPLFYGLIQCFNIFSSEMWWFFHCFDEALRCGIFSFFRFLFLI